MVCGSQDQEAVTAVRTEVEAGTVGVVVVEAVVGACWRMSLQHLVGEVGDRTGHGFEAWVVSLAGNRRMMEILLQQVGCCFR